MNFEIASAPGLIGSLLIVLAVGMALIVAIWFITLIREARSRDEDAETGGHDEGPGGMT